jgi:hypothetical protein
MTDLLNFTTTNIHLASVDAGLQPVFDWAWDTILQYILLGLVIFAVIKLMHDQKTFKVVLTIIGASFAWYFVTHFATVFNFFDTVWGKFFG